MNALLTLVIASFLIVTVLSEYSGGKSFVLIEWETLSKKRLNTSKCVPAGNAVAEANYDAALAEGGSETGEGYRRKMRRRVHAKKLRVKKTMKKRLAKKVKKVRRKTVKKNKH
ncbi:hypothetical protein Y032_0031g2268 [Ancylostoma ceylanicum]|uniref:Uncharacterized protein n=1 Tax=Ancylostoma ceylanicum TaxID=53326 RepID=A0A016UPL5_9BILA|nr:hypothetical protein Y032_0031g2268 [Ancylostoma ceylanicum]